eukprot:6051817-Prymnesium_polylepis.1
MAGACWVLPQFIGKPEVAPLIETLKKKLVPQMAAATDTVQPIGSHVDLVVAFTDLWGPGGPLSNLATNTTTRDRLAAWQSDTDTHPNGGLLQVSLRAI